MPPVKRRRPRRATRPEDLTAAQIDLLEEPISVLETPTRPANSLERAGIYTIKDLLMWSEPQLRTLADIGPLTISHIMGKLAEFGFHQAPKKRKKRTRRKRKQS